MLGNVRDNFDFYFKDKPVFKPPDDQSYHIDVDAQDVPKFGIVPTMYHIKDTDQDKFYVHEQFKVLIDTLLRIDQTFEISISSKSLEEKRSAIQSHETFNSFGKLQCFRTVTINGATMSWILCPLILLGLGANKDDIAMNMDRNIIDMGRPFITDEGCENTGLIMRLRRSDNFPPGLLIRRCFG